MKRKLKRSRRPDQRIKVTPEARADIQKNELTVAEYADKYKISRAWVYAIQHAAYNEQPN